MSGPAPLAVIVAEGPENSIELYWPRNNANHGTERASRSATYSRARRLVLASLGV